ncbi:hypothetical protein PHYSODRAFT_297050 [Phytophthora sojae]|uniref:Uncharacterized protein n=1 Tax=Phytophthora sojae (strain P6497) TaxID=1094619 RepID=G4YSD2_PHYSP|nr:hypothetical protein PHYSODRAFT_297050 [Phytophthora sojae]EGZ25363.1 hypothetical protein PHYSODRAFT_297050 [Phytophthora sojae]|eukprot:XP_009520651.1 hypothetical protein PHYSODRAFT_297050 [Phytophthora sojae]
MKSLGRLWGTGLVLASVLVSAKADIELTSVVYFNAEDSCQDAVGPPPLVSATVASSCEDLTTCELTDGAYHNTICVTTDGSTSGEFYSMFLSCGRFPANGKCNTDGATSFVATIAGTGDATLMFYADTECTPGQENGGLKQLSLDQDTSKSACLDDSNGAYSMAYGSGVTVIDSSGSTSSSGPTNANSGGEGSTTGKYTVGAFFEDSECNQPTSVSIGTRDCSADFTASCMKVTEHYIQTSCTEDYLEYASAAFDGTPYLVEKHYDKESCTTEDHAMVYKADNACHTLSMTGAPQLHSNT